MKNLALIMLFSCTSLIATVSVNTKQISESEHAITLSFDLKPGEYVYKEHVHFSVDNPSVTLSQWRTDTPAEKHFDHTFNDTKEVLSAPHTITVNAHTDNPNVTDATIHYTYYINTDKKIVEKTIPLTFKHAIATLETAVAVNDANIEYKEPAERAIVGDSWSTYISSLVQATDSLWVRLLLVFLLGILLSLTPCIYPMIPITIGVLQSRGSTSLLSNFFISLCYTSGIATTFALFGLAAAFTGQMFGSIMRQPLFILLIVALLIYLALSMLGFYTMYVPKSLQAKQTNVKGGSWLSAFAFGAASGTFASPCLSPGLVLLLSIVTTLGSAVQGFLLLFSFGIGLGVPLLLIGTFSTSLTMLPRAGSWMLEVKEFFGFILLGMCFYFLKTIAPLHLILWGVALLTVAAGLFYLNKTRTDAPGITRTVHALMGMLMIGSSLFVAAHALKATYNTPEIDTFWETDLESARKKARLAGKKLFVDISAPFCSICTAIDKTVMHDTAVRTALSSCVCVKIDGSDTSNAACAALCSQHSVVGFPTFLLVDPNDNSAIKRWGSELYECSNQCFIDDINDNA